MRQSHAGAERRTFRISFVLVQFIIGIIFLAPNRASGDSVAPSAPPVSYTNSVDFNFTSNVFSFIYQDANGTLTYEYAPGADGSFHPLRCKVNDNYVFRPSNVGGLSLRMGATEIFPWQAGVGFQMLNAHAAGKALLTSWKMTNGANSQIYTYQFQISGRTLTIQATTTNGNAGGVYLDRCEDATKPVVVLVPYLTTMNVLYASGVFGSMFFDWESTSASTIYPLNSVYSASSVYFAERASYLPHTDGTLRNVNETIYLTVSPSLTDVLPNVPNPQSAYRALLSKYLVFDDWQTPFATVGQNVQALHNAGISNLWVIVHPWQHGGYDNQYPNVLPANAAWGGDAGLKAVSQTIRTNGYLFALHENYVDFYPNAAAWDTNAIALNSDGSLKAAWSNATIQIQSYEMKPTLAANYLANFAPQIHSNYATTASFLDVHSSANPSDKVDCDAGTTNAAMFHETMSRYRALAALLRACHQGPVSGEGCNHLLFVGYFDDIEAQINSGSYAPRSQGSWLPLLVDFELLKLHDKTLSHGAGYYERFYSDTNGNSQFLTFSKNDALEYMATELACGHGGFIPTPARIYDFVDLAILEQRHVLPAQALYAKATPTNILYHDSVSDDEVSASDYIRRYPASFSDQASDHYMSQVRVTYDNGVVVCVNRHPSRQWQVNLGYPGGFFNFNAVMNGTNNQWVGQTNLTSYLLPQTNGWVVFAPNPTPPGISAVTLTNGIFSFVITNLLPGISNHVETSSDLSPDDWQITDTFVSTSTQTNWSQGLSNDLKQMFYRVVRLW